MGSANMPGSDKMTSQCALMQDGSLESENGEYRLTMQGDGNLVLYNSGGEPLWASGTDGEYGAHCVFQKDGHFLVYRCGEDGRVSTDPDDCVWKTDIYGDEAPSTVAGAACRTMATSSSMTARAVLCGALAPTVASRATAPAASTGSSKCVQLASVH